MRSNGFTKVVLCLVVGALLALATPGIAHAQFSDTGIRLSNVALGAIAWGDYDNDGDLDLVQCGQPFGSSPDYATELWRNDGGSFTQVAAALFAEYGARGGSLDWGDFDNDGDLDLLIAGDANVGGMPLMRTTVFRNDGMDVFTDIAAGITPCNFGAAKWGDYDNDGDLDIALTGQDVAIMPVSEIWRNNGDETFTEIGAGLTPLKSGSLDWGDYDNDGDLDLLHTGADAGDVPYSKVYRNDGMDTFTDIGAALIGVDSSDAAWGDYDNDGDLDALLAGGDENGDPVSFIYNNDGGVFTDIGAGIRGGFFMSLEWGDFDNDGDLDILQSGQNAGFFSTVYRNNGDDTFTDLDPGLPDAATVKIRWGDYDNDGDLDIALGGFLQTQIWRNDLPPTPDRVFTTIPMPISTLNLPQSFWGDYDVDGDLDILQTGSPAGISSQTRVWRNDGNNVFTDTMIAIDGSLAFAAGWADFDVDGDIDLAFGHQLSSDIWINNRDDTFTAAMAGLPNWRVEFPAVAWGDYDNDGDPDLLVSDLVNLVTPTTRLWRNNRDGTLTLVAAGLIGISPGAIAWGDYDNDGDLDLLLAGRISNNNPVSVIYRNDGGDTFTDIMAGVTPLVGQSADWGDYDNDGDLDFVLTGFYEYGSNADAVAGIWRNDGNGTFTEIGGSFLAQLAGSASWGDYDNDGDLDLVLNGRDNSSALNEALDIWRNDGNDTFTRMPTRSQTGRFGSVLWGDYDRDGDLDLLRSGFVFDVGNVTEILRNDTCSVTIDPPSNTVGGEGASGLTIDIDALDESCPWTAVSNDAWITITGPDNGTGDGSIAYDVAANLGAARMGSITIEGETHTVTQDACGAPMITQQPASLTGCDNAPSFTAAASGSPAPTVQWQVSDGGAFADIPGATNTTLTLNMVTAADVGNQYRAVFTNACGEATTEAVTLGPIGAPTEASVAVVATDATFTDRVRVTWRGIEGVDEYKVFRSAKSNLSNPVQLSVVVGLRTFDDFSAVPSGMGCRGKTPQRFYYYVVATNECGDGPPSAVDSGIVGTPFNAGFNSDNAGDLALLVLALAGMWLYQRRQRKGNRLSWY